MTTLHVCRAVIDDIKAHRSHCPICTRRTAFVSWFQEWYGWHATCLRCGDAWEDQELLPRPFRPRWRTESIASARKLYRKHRPKKGNVFHA